MWPTKDQLKSVGLVASIVSALVTVASLALTLKQVQAGLESDRIAEWQEVVVYSIVERSGDGGASFDTVRDAYLNEVQALTDFEIPKAAIQPFALRRVLLQLQARDLVLPVTDGKYIAVKGTQNPSYSRQHILEAAMDEINSLVTTESGKLSVEDIRRKIQTSIKQVEFDRLMSELVSGSSPAAIVDGDGKVWSSTKPPPRR